MTKSNMRGEPDPAPAATGGWTPRNVYTLALLTVIMVLNYIDRNTFGVVLPAIKRELGLSDATLGIVSGLAFALFYSTLSIPVAVLADRVSRRNIVAVGLALWSAMMACTGLAANAWQLALARLLMGAAETAGIAPSSSMVADLFARGRRTVAISILTTGSALGALIGFPLAGWLSQAYGWRTVFFAMGVPGLILAGIFFLTVREPQRGAFESRRAALDSPTLRQTVPFLISNKSYVLTVLGAGVLSIHLYMVVVWSATFLTRVHHLNLGRAGAALGLLVGLGGVVGGIAGGALTDALARHDERWRAWTPALAAVLVCPADGLFLFAPNVALSLLGLGLASVCANMVLGPALALAVNVVRVRMRALASAIVMSAGSLIGQVAGPLAVGLLNDWMSPVFGEATIRYSMLVGAAAGLGAGLILASASRYILQDMQRAASDSE
jgi:MFS family permease